MKRIIILSLFLLPAIIPNDIYAKSNIELPKIVETKLKKIDLNTSYPDGQDYEFIRKIVFKKKKEHIKKYGFIKTSKHMFSIDNNKYWLKFVKSDRKNAVYSVIKNSSTILTVKCKQSVKEPIDSFYKNKKNWILEYTNKVIVNGKHIGVNKFEQVYNYVFISDRPFYFYKNNGTHYISYNGKTLKNNYDRIVHYQCCDPTLFNPLITNKTVCFVASRDGYWYFVEVLF